MKIGRFIALGLVASILCLPGTASPERAPTPREKRAIAAGFDRHASTGCFTIFVSDISSRWASLTWGSTRHGESAQQFLTRCPGAANGLAILHKEKRGWRYVVDAGSDPPGKCPLAPAPAKVGADLKACLLPERLCDAPDLVYAPSTTSCEMARRVDAAYQKETGGALEAHSIQAVSPEDHKTYRLKCTRDGDTMIVCEGRRHRVSIWF